VRSEVEQVLARIRPQLQMDGCTVELASVEDGVVRLRLAGGCMGCPLSKMALLAGLEETLKESVPGITRVEAVR
jgi:Fe-S cluster biogenesis protein NfuA